MLFQAPSGAWHGSSAASNSMRWVLRLAPWWLCGQQCHVWVTPKVLRGRTLAAHRGGSAVALEVLLLRIQCRRPLQLVLEGGVEGLGHVLLGGIAWQEAGSRCVLAGCFLVIVWELLETSISFQHAFIRQTLLKVVSNNVDGRRACKRCRGRCTACRLGNWLQARHMPQGLAAGKQELASSTMKMQATHVRACHLIGGLVQKRS